MMVSCESLFLYYCKENDKRSSNALEHEKNPGVIPIHVLLYQNYKKGGKYVDVYIVHNRKYKYTNTNIYICFFYNQRSTEDIHIN